jgi:uncharacterized membrane protein
MDNLKQTNTLFRLGIIGAFTALAFAGTAVIRVPLPASGGYFNLGDTFVMTAALLYGPLAGAITGLIGPSLADAIGYPQFILATAVVKGIEGLLVGMIGWRAQNGLRPTIGLALGVGVLVAGYYVFEAWIYPAMGRTIPFFAVTDANAALAEIIPNLLQGIISAVIALGIWKALKSRID